jgi:glycine/D-amino acid oxidase-like deaminating enzyme
MRIERHTPGGWWLEEAGEPAPAPRLEGALEADVVVVGGGFTGMWTAWHLLEADPRSRVAILEGGLCAHGPSGRNGGFCESLWLSAPALRARFGDEAALDLLRASSETVGRIGAWCEAEGVDAWFDQSGYVCASTAPAFDGVGAAAAEAAAALGAPERVVALDEAAVRARCDSPVLRGGVLIPDFATVQPARLGLGLRRRLHERGAAVRERSRVHSLSVEGDGVLARTDHGSVRARAAVMAMGPAVRGVRQLRSRLSVASSHVVLTEPVPDVLAALGWTGGECITDGRTLVHYFRTTRDGRIAFGWGGGRPAFGARVGGRAEVDHEVAGDVVRGLLRVFPALEGRRITHAWGGPVDVSPSHLPQVGSLPGAPVHYAFGFTGNGVGPTHLAGRVLAALAAGRDDPVTRLALVGSPPGAWVPPEPLAWLGGTLVRSALVRRERIDEAGGRVGPLTLAACAAPRALGIHLGR